MTYIFHLNTIWTETTPWSYQGNKNICMVSASLLENANVLLHVNPRQKGLLTDTFAGSLKKSVKKEIRTIKQAAPALSRWDGRPHRRVFGLWLFPHLLQCNKSIWERQTHKVVCIAEGVSEWVEVRDRQRFHGDWTQTLKRFRKGMKPP